MSTNQDFESYAILVRRDNLNLVEVRNSENPEKISLKTGQVLLKIDSFALTSNNMTYAHFGDAMNYWSFFPAPDGFGMIPVWGYADVVASNHKDIQIGERIYGYLPISSFLVVRPDRVTVDGFLDSTEHRRQLPRAYNQYSRCANDPIYNLKHEAEQALFRPLFTTGFLLDDYMAQEHYWGATTIFLSSASSKTAYSTAMLLKNRKGVTVVGLTSAAHLEFAKQIGCYDRVLAYDNMSSIEANAKSVYVDMSGSRATRRSIHSYLENNLVQDIVIGATHFNESGNDPNLTGVPPTLFFAPTQMVKLSQKLGKRALTNQIALALNLFIERVTNPQHLILRVVRSSGPNEIVRIYHELLQGKALPILGHVLSI